MEAKKECCHFFKHYYTTYDHPHYTITHLAAGFPIHTCHFICGLRKSDCCNSSHKDVEMKLPWGPLKKSWKAETIWCSQSPTKLSLWLRWRNNGLRERREKDTGIWHIEANHNIQLALLIVINIFQWSLTYAICKGNDQQDTVCH